MVVVYLTQTKIHQVHILVLEVNDNIKKGFQRSHELPRRVGSKSIPVEKCISTGYTFTMKSLFLFPSRRLYLSLSMDKQHLNTDISKEEIAITD